MRGSVLLEATRRVWVEAGEAVAHTRPPPAPARSGGRHDEPAPGASARDSRAGISTSAPREVPVPPEPVSSVPRVVELVLHRRAGAGTKVADPGELPGLAPR